MSKQRRRTNRRGFRKGHRQSGRKRGRMTRSLLTERLEDRRLLSADVFPMHNPLVPTDVTGDWETTPLDALLVINYLNRQSAQSNGVSATSTANDGRYLDTIPDNQVTPLDALTVINELNVAEGAPGDKVQFRLDVLDMDGNPLARDAQGRVHVSVGQDFRFQTYVQDVQNNPDGLASAYLDTGYFETPDEGADNPGADLFAVVIGETQRLTLNSDTIANGTGTFRLQYTKPGAASGTFTDPITLASNKNETAANIKAALEGLGAQGPEMVEVTRDPVDGNSPVWYIRFVGPDRFQDVPALVGDFSGLSTAVGHTIEDNFHQVDPNDIQTFRIAFTVNDLFKGSKTAYRGSTDIDGDSATNLNWESEFDEIGGTNFSGYLNGGQELEYDLIGTLLTAEKPGTITFQANMAELSGSLVVLTDIGVPLTEGEIDFGSALEIIVTKPVNAEDDAFTVVEDITQDLDVLKLSAADGTVGKDFLEDGSTGTLALSSVAQPAHGVTSIVGGMVRYDPDLNFNGGDTFTYTAADGLGNFDTATVTITVTPVNDAPNAANATFAVDEDSDPATDDGNVFDLSPFFSDVDGDVVNVSGLGPAGNQSQIQTSHGVATLVAGQVAYLPDANYFGQDTFEYTVSDEQAMDNATVTVNVTAVNDPPTAVDDERTIAEDPAVPLVIDVVANDSPGPLEDGVDSLTITSPLVTAPDQGGIVNVNNNNLEYTPAANFFGDETFEYQVEDTGGLSATAWVTVHVTPVDDVPTAADDAYNVEEFSTDNPLRVLQNDSPGGGLFEEDRADMFIVQVGATSNGGSVRIDPANDTQLLYSPPVGLAWSPTEDFIDTFTYTMSDTAQAGNHEQSALVTVTLDPAIRPRARDDQRSLDEDSHGDDPNTALHVTANDLFNDGADPTTRTLQVTRVPLHGTATVIGSGATLDIQYLPFANYAGPDSLQYEITDGLGANDADSQAARVGEVTITVNDVNDVPVATDDAFTVVEDSNPATDPANVFDVVVDDNSGVDAGETLIVVGLGLGAGPHTATTITTTQGATATLQADGTIQYTPAADFFNDQGGPLDTFQYTIRDRAVGDPEGLTATATVTVTVQNTNDNPDATDNAFTVLEDSDPATDVANVFDVKSDDSFAPDPAETLTVIGLGPSNQAMITTAQGATVELQAGGDVTYKPAADWFNDLGGRPVDTFTYTLQDEGGLTDTATVRVTVQNVNDNPTATPDTGDDALLGLKGFDDQTFDVLSNDSIAPDINETLTIIGLGLPGDTPDSSSIVTPYGTARISDDGLTVLYSAGDVQGVTDTFFYQISDNNGLTAVAQADVEIVDAVPSDISGRVHWGTSKFGLAGVTVFLSGTNLRGDPIDTTVQTDANGVFRFTNILPNAVGDAVGYSIRANTPTGMIDGLEHILNESHTDGYDSGIAGDDVVTGIRLGLLGTTGAVGNYEFGEAGWESQYSPDEWNIPDNWGVNGPKGLIMGTNMAGDDFWFSIMDGWEGIRSAHVQLSQNLETATLTIVDSGGQPHTHTLDYRSYYLHGDGDQRDGRYTIYFHGTAEELGFNLPGEGDLAEGEAPVSGEAGSYAQDVDSIFGSEGWV